MRLTQGVQLFGLFLMFMLPVFAAPSDDLSFITANNPIPQGQSQTQNLSSSRLQTHEVSIFTVGLLRFYQTCISSQDTPSCSFTPSCSRFAAQAINRCGFVRGSLLAADRLERCQPYNRSEYPIDPVTGSCSDPLDKYVGGTH
jgi:hypothetical protein